MGGGTGCSSQSVRLCVETNPSCPAPQTNPQFFQAPPDQSPSVEYPSSPLRYVCVVESSQVDVNLENLCQERIHEVEECRGGGPLRTCRSGNLDQFRLNPGGSAHAERRPAVVWREHTADDGQTRSPNIAGRLGPGPSEQTHKRKRAALATEPGGRLEAVRKKSTTKDVGRISNPSVHPVGRSGNPSYG